MTDVIFQQCYILTIYLHQTTPLQSSPTPSSSVEPEDLPPFSPTSSDLLQALEGEGEVVSVGRVDLIGGEHSDGRYNIILLLFLPHTQPGSQLTF